MKVQLIIGRAQYEIHFISRKFWNTILKYGGETKAEYRSKFSIFIKFNQAFIKICIFTLKTT